MHIFPNLVTYDSVVGRLEYKSLWSPVMGRKLPSEHDVLNVHKLFAVAVMKDDNIVGHVPRKISTVCSLFLRRGGLIELTGRRRYS